MLVLPLIDADQPTSPALTCFTIRGRAPCSSRARWAPRSGSVSSSTQVSEPVLPLHLFRIRTISVGSPLNLVAGVALFGAVTFLPSYLQVVNGENAPRPGE